MASLGDRIIVLIDMDCFFCQVESRLQPALEGKPVAVVQYNQWRNGGIIAVNYEARDFGVTRHMRGDEAKEKCPDIALVSVPSLRGKADTSKYRSAGREVVDVLKKHCSVIERASVDEAYLDITELVEKRIASAEVSKSELIGSLTNTFVVEYCDDESNDEEQRTDGVERWINEAYAELGDVQARKLAIAGTIVEELRAEIYNITKFRCSAGISFNKILAKLACGLHKPNRQTILPQAAVSSLYATLPVKKVRNLGGKFGNIVVESLGCNVMADLTRYSLQDLQKRFDEKTGSWLFNIARGIDNEPVTTRLVCKSIGSSKNFPGKQAIVKFDALKHWVGELSADVSDRLEQDFEENERRATTLTVSFSYYEDRQAISQSRSFPLKSYKAERIALQSIEAITKSTQKPIANIGIAAGKFVQSKGSGNFINFFKSNENSTMINKTTSTELSGTERIVDESRGETEKTNFKKCKPKADDFFAKKTQSRRESSPLTKISGDAENPEKPKSNGENLFAESTRPGEQENLLMAVISSYDSGKTDITETPPKPKFKISAGQTRNANDTTLNTDEPTSPSTAILGSSQCKKALNRDNLKNSFFMNFLKDSKPEFSPPVCTEESASLYCQNSNDSPRKDEDREKNNDETKLLAQLEDIFPDLDDIDRSVVQLLPIELQRFANSYLKSKVSSKVQSVRIATKIKTKTSKSRKVNAASNSVQNFFVKTSPNGCVDSTLRKCNDCNQMIQHEKFQQHKDFHVAQNLQRTINQTEAREGVNDSPAKSTTTSNSVESTVFKRKLQEDRPKVTKKPKTISSFFST